MSHLPAIFLQQAISGSVIERKSAAQAIAGSRVHPRTKTNASQRTGLLDTYLGYTPTRSHATKEDASTEGAI